MAKQPIRAVLRLNSLSVAQKISKGHYILQQLGLYGALFPATMPTPVPEMKATVEKLDAAHTAAEGGGRLAHAQEVVAEVAFDTVFGGYRDWANQPEIAYNDAVKIEQLGLDLSRQPQPSHRLAAPLNVRLSGEDTGELTAACDSLDGARALVWFVAVTPDADTVPTDADYRYHTASTRTRVILTDLPSGHVVWVRVLAVGPLGPGPLSAAARRRVL